MEENSIPQVTISDAIRFPLLPDLSFLHTLQQDAFAPNFNFKSGDRLNAEQLKAVQHYKKTYYNIANITVENESPKWLSSYLASCLETVPFYRKNVIDIENFPTICRDDIRNNADLFVSDSANLNDLLVYYTSGSTGPKLNVLFDAVSQANWLPQIEWVLKDFNISIEKGKSTTAIALICAQEKTLTYASLSTYLEGAGILKINLNENDWKQSDHAVLYLEKYNPQILTGDPIAFMSLLDLKPKITPKALISSAMKLTKGTQSALESYFKCPVIDLYSLTECRNIAYATPIGYKAIRPDLYLEVFDTTTDTKLPYGQRGELVVTGGNNPFLPLVRYRTGDFCSLELINGVVYLVGLEARKPVVFVTKSDLKINNIDISNALSHLPLAGFKMHQTKDKSIEFVGYSNANIYSEVEQIIKTIFKSEISIHVSILSIENTHNVSKTHYSTNFL